MLSGSYQSPNNENNSRSVSSSMKGISVTGAVVLYKMRSGYSEEDVVIDPLIQQANAIGVEDLHSCISYQTICTTGERGTERYTGVNACMCVGNMYNGCWPLGGM